MYLPRSLYLLLAPFLKNYNVPSTYIILTDEGCVQKPNLGTLSHHKYPLRGKMVLLAKFLLYHPLAKCRWLAVDWPNDVVSKLFVPFDRLEADPVLMWGHCNLYHVSSRRPQVEAQLQRHHQRHQRCRILVQNKIRTVDHLKIVWAFATRLFTWAIPGPFFTYFRPFQTNNIIITAN